MTWMRDLLFLGIVGGGLVLLGANLIPHRVAKVKATPAQFMSEPDLLATAERVNASFRQQWASAGIKPASPASNLQIARRLSLSLMGVIPSLEEIRQLEALPSDQQLVWWLDRIFRDRRYVDYVAERLARVYVGTEDGPFIFFRRRRLVSWLEEAVARNRPYNEIAYDLIASKGLWTDQPATNFVSVTCQQDKENQPDPVRLAGRATRAFLGLRLDCAQCHNHPFASWEKADFDNLAAFFGQTHVGFKGIYDGSGEYEVKDRKTHALVAVSPRVPFAPELLPSSGTRRQQLAGWITHPKNPYFARAAVNRVWAILFGRPLVDPVDNLEPDGSWPSVLQILADDFAAHAFDLRHLIRTIASTEVFRIDSAASTDESDDQSWAVFALTRLRPEQVAGSILQASSVATLNARSHILARVIRWGQQNDFITRYGDATEDEFSNRSGTIPQRLLLMNGQLVRERVKDDLGNASTRIAMMSPDDRRAIENAYLATLTRRPTPAELDHFAGVLADTASSRSQELEDLYWVLLNSTEFSWNH